MNRSAKTVGSPLFSEDNRDLSPFWASVGLAAVVIVAILALSPALEIGFAGDDFNWLEAPAVRSGDDFPRFFGYASEHIRRAVSEAAYFSLGRTWWDLNPRPWHAANLVVFGVDILLLYAFLLKTLHRRLPALIGAAIFGLCGAPFMAQISVTGSAEMLAAMFVFAALLAHVSALDRRAVGRKAAVLEVVSVVFVILALGTKETMLPLPLVFVALDLLALRRVTAASIASILCAGGFVALNLSELALIETRESYHLAVSPASFVANLLAYFYDPILATGGQYWLVDRLGVAGHGPAAIGGLVALAKEHPLNAALLGLGGTVVAVLCAGATLGVGWFGALRDGRPRPLVPRAFGWLSWFVMIVPVLMIPGHHSAYYLTVPLGLLMVAVGPALAAGLRRRGWKAAVAIALALYFVWFPINTHLAFKLSSVPRFAAMAERFREEFDQVMPQYEPGSALFLDQIEPELNVAIGYGAALGIWYPDLWVLTFPDLHEWLDEEGLPKIAEHSPEIFVFRREDGVWRDVTEEFREQLGQVGPQ